MYIKIAKSLKLIYTLSSPFLHMPYKTIEDAKKAGFPTTITKVNLTLPQINHLATIYDGIKSGGGADEPMAVAIAQFKDAYKIEDNKWVLIKKEGEHETWIPVAKANQERAYEDGRTEILTEGAIINSVNSWKGKGVAINHKTSMGESHEIRDAKYEAPFLYMKFDPKTEGIFKNSDATGWSVKFDSMRYDGNKLVDAKGKNISILYYPHAPSCTPEMGCYETFDTKKSNGDLQNGESELKRITEEVRNGFKRIKGVLKSVTLIKSKKEEEDQENKNRKNLDKKSKMETEEKLTLDLKTANDKLAKIKGEFETIKTEHDTEVKELKEQVAVFEKEKEDTRTAKIDSDWEQLKKTVIPVGLIHKEEDEKALRAEFEQSPHEFMMRAFEFERPTATEEQGSEFETNPDEITKATKEMDEAAGMEAPHGN